MSALETLELVDGLYRSAILEPATIDDPSLAEWMEAAAESVALDREQIKVLRKVVRHARKLAATFSSRRAEFPDWRHGVDEVLGARGWEPHLDLVRRELASHPSEEVFAAVKQWHRAVHFTEWMEGVPFEEWGDRG